MKDIQAIKGRNYILSLIEEGEHEHQDFKFAISDARKIARSISAFANNDGGHLLIGVKDNGAVAGIRNEEDLYMIETAAETFCRPAVTVDMTAFKVDPGVIVVRARISKALHPPVCVVEDDRQLKAYYRVRDENMAAPPVLISAWSHYRNPDGTLLHLDASHQTLLAMLRSRGSLTVDEFIRHSHLPSDAATDLIGRLLAASVVNITHNGSAFVIIP